MNFAQWLGFIGLLIAFYILWHLQQLLLLIFCAVVLATALNRLVLWLQRRQLHRSSAVWLALILCLLFTILFVWLVIPPFFEQFQRLIELIPRAVNRLSRDINDLQANLPDFLPQPPNLADIIAQLTPLTTNILGNFFTIFSTSFTTLGKILLVLVLTLMMLFAPQPYRRGFLRLFPSFYRRRADYILTQSEIALSNWLSGMAINCLFIGIASGLGLWLLRIPLVLVHALLAGVLNFIPNIGPLVSAIFPIAIALLEDPWKIIAVLILYFIIQNLESYWLSPTVMANKVSLLPAVTLTAQIFFAKTFGILGLMLALPLTVVAKTWIEEVLFQDILDGWNYERK
ncbi:MAG: AI-2E family transporter [Jaaginema sp. PMC 1079.18]|nr:AI-2E family transporter [Jaaginema sp. PMC 1080.18]MEC4849929.1 AI-2E family transporter [Jaaginema sp. PMC 1079.18]MEC4865174.1 AI-2E family transporter [Jaaginema sp. PMC 1078.18]